MKKTIYTKNYKLVFIKNWVMSMNDEVKIEVMETYKEEYEGFSEKFSRVDLVGTYLLNILNGMVEFYGYELYPSEVPLDRANMLRKEWKKIRKEFEGGKRLQYGKYY